MSTRRTARPPFAVRCFAAAVWMLPPDDRARHGAAMVSVFESLHAEARAQHGWLGGLRVLAAEVPGVVRLIVAAHLAARQSALRPVPVPPPDLSLAGSGHDPLAPNPFPNRSPDMIDSLSQDLRYALRSLARTPGFTAVALATLALGIGANTAVFSIVNGVLLAPLAFERPNELVVLGEGTTNGPLTDLNSTSPGSFYDWQRQATSMRVLAAYSTSQATLTGRSEPLTLNGVSTVGDVFQVLGVRAALGRTSTIADEQADERVVVLSDNAWRKRFGADPAVVGTSIILNGTPRTVIGVMPPSFRFPDGSAEYWTPFRFSPEFKTNRDQYMLAVIGRLAPGVTLARARVEMEAISARMRQEWAQYNSQLRIDVVPMHETIVGSVRQQLGLLMGAVVFVLLIACANLGNLLLSRSVTRRREMAVRQALGAGRTRLMRQLLTESLVLSLGGAIVGVAVGAGFLRLMLAQQSIALPRIDEIGLDLRALGFTFALALLAALFFGLVPAFQLSSRGSADAMREGARGSAKHGWVRNILVVSEFALAMMLLAGAGLLLHSFARLTRVDPGLRTERLLTFNVQLRKADPTFAARSLDRLRGLPGVSAAAIISQIPVTGRGNGAWFNIVDRPTPAGVTPRGEIYRVISHEYFTTAGVPLRRGRLLTGAERADNAPAVVINEALARQYWPGEDPIGKQIWLGAPENHLTPFSTIVGIVGDTKDAGLGSAALPIVYVPIGMMPTWPYLSYVVRTANEPAGLVRAVREEMRSLDASLPIQSLATMDAVLQDAVAPARWSMTLLAVFAAVALLLAAIGIFGVLSFIVTQRTRELGIRMALGASPERVRAMVVGHGLTLALVGTALGLIGALALSRVMTSMLFDVATTDPLTYAVVAGLLLAVGAAASYLPARRATRVDPMVALQSE